MSDKRTPAFAAWLKKNLKFIFPICVVIAVAVIVSAVLIHGKSKEASISAMDETGTDIVAAIGAENPLEGDKYPELNALIETYLNALADGDADTIAGLTNNMTDIERIRIEELGKYIDAFPAFNVFTKIGPAEGSYIVYAAVRAQFQSIEELIPGIYCFYVCTDENGQYYFNETTLSEEEQSYIDAINADESVVGLMESLDSEYQEMLDSSEEIRTYIEVMQTEIRGAVGAALASNAQETTEEGTENGDPTVVQSDCTAVTTDTINVRSSDSETADKIGKLDKGTVVEVIEIRVNGWSKIYYEGGEAYVKTDYLEVQKQAEEAGTGENTANGRATAKETVNVRTDADQNSVRLGQLVSGEEVDWIADLDNGWSKIIYNGKVGYVKTEFLDVN